MKKSEIKKLIKPIVSECIQEVLLESGIVSNIVSEVMKGMMPVLQESKARRPIQETSAADTLPLPRKPSPNAKYANFSNKMRERSPEQEQDLESINESAYGGISGMNIGGVNIFEGVKPVAAQRDTSGGAMQGPLGDAGDPGIDISKLGIIKQLK